MTVFFFLIIDVPIEVSMICLNFTNLVIYIQVVLLPNNILNFFSQSFKFWSEFLTARLFLRIFLLISGAIQGTEETDRLVLEGMCLSAES